MYQRGIGICKTESVLRQKRRNGACTLWDGATARRWVNRAACAADAKGMVALLKMPRPLVALGDQEKRIFPRKEVHAAVQAARKDHTVEARRDPHLTLTLRDLSLGGMSAISPTPLNNGERLQVHFPRLGTVGGWDAMGYVLRCNPSAMGYRIAVEFDPLPVAA